MTHGLAVVGVVLYLLLWRRSDGLPGKLHVNAASKGGFAWRACKGSHSAALLTGLLLVCRAPWVQLALASCMHATALKAALEW
jgi:hypothetical protein